MLGILITPALRSSYRLKSRLGDWSNVTLLAGGGTLMMFFGMLLASISTRLWHLIVLQGITVGIGASLLAYPVQTIAPEYFDKHQALAMGLVTAGRSISS
jgi:uncharacterized membrane protein YfcA